MAATTFSLTKDIVIDPIITATLQPLPNSYDDDAMMEHCCNTEVLTRIGSVFISAFAVADAFVHLVSALYKTAGFALAFFGCLNPADWDGDEISQHFIKTAFFAALSVAGPVVGFVYPGAFLEYWGVPAGYVPPPPPLFPPINYQNVANPGKEPNLISNAEFFKLVEDVKAGNAKVAWPQLQIWFNCGSVEEKILFFEIFGSDEIPEFAQIRELFSKAYYKPVPGADQADRSGWLSSAELAKRLDPNDPLVLKAQQEVMAISGEADAAFLGEEDQKVPDALLAELAAAGFDVPQTARPSQNPTMSAEERIESIFHQAVRLNEGLYFHGTRNEPSVKSILEGGKIEVRHQGAFKGAFVSTIPERDYGPYYFVFKQCVGFCSKPLINMQPVGGYSGYWAGLSDDIPVTETTLAYITVRNGTEASCADLALRVKQWAGRDISVIPFDLITARLAKLKANSQVVPSHWN